MVSDKVQKVSSEFSSQLDSDPDTHIVRIRLSVHKKKPSSPVDQSDAFASVTYDDDPERMSGQSSRSQTNSRLVFLETDDGSDHPHKATQDGRLNSETESVDVSLWSKVLDNSESIASTVLQPSTELRIVSDDRCPISYGSNFYSSSDSSSDESIKTISKVGKHNNCKIHPFKALYFDARVPAQTPRDLWAHSLTTKTPKKTPISGSTLVLQTAPEASFPQKHNRIDTTTCETSFDTFDPSNQDINDIWAESRREKPRTEYKHKERGFDEETNSTQTDSSVFDQMNSSSTVTCTSASMSKATSNKSNT